MAMEEELVEDASEIEEDKDHTLPTDIGLMIVEVAAEVVVGAEAAEEDVVDS